MKPLQRSSPACSDTDSRVAHVFHDQSGTVLRNIGTGWGGEHLVD